MNSNHIEDYFTQEFSDDFRESEPELTITSPGYSSNNESLFADDSSVIDDNLFVDKDSHIKETLLTNESLSKNHNLSATSPNKKSIEVTTAFCHISGCKVLCAYHRSTTNLLDHLRKKHNITKESEYNKYIQQNISEKKLIQQKLEHILIKLHDLRKQEKIIQKLLKLIVGEGLSLILIECKWFREFVNYINPRFKIPCVKTFSKYIFQSYEYSTSLLKQILHTSANSISLTANI
ncbi:12081_t:CDS:2 [Cetraspora pellucida]|uniref:12081_t:CDS:1 n=1 Tax=Cetraspora pellucida TaxID=1433469 RepID=A0A9N9NVU2_9GLOM|nr:12081_t:CDS:2 [Cetraspora pellucida]